MIKEKTKTGFKFEVDGDVVRDMEFIELAAASQEDGLLLPKVIELVLGTEQKKALYDHVRNENGRVIVDDVSREFGEILDAINEAFETKN